MLGFVLIVTLRPRRCRCPVAAFKEGYDLAALRCNAGKFVTAERLDALSTLTWAQGILPSRRRGVCECAGGTPGGARGVMMSHGETHHKKIAPARVAQSVEPKSQP